MIFKKGQYVMLTLNEKFEKMQSCSSSFFDYEREMLQIPSLMRIFTPLSCQLKKEKNLFTFIEVYERLEKEILLLEKFSKEKMIDEEEGKKEEVEGEGEEETLRSMKCLEQKQKSKDSNFLNSFQLSQARISLKKTKEVYETLTDALSAENKFFRFGANSRLIREGDYLLKKIEYIKFYKIKISPEDGEISDTDPRLKEELNLNFKPLQGALKEEEKFLQKHKDLRTLREKAKNLAEKLAEETKFFNEQVLEELQSFIVKEWSPFFRKLSTHPVIKNVNEQYYQGSLFFKNEITNMLMCDNPVQEGVKIYKDPFDFEEEKDKINVLNRKEKDGKKLRVRFTYKKT